MYWKDVEKETIRFANFMKRQVLLAYLPPLFLPKDDTFGQETVDQALDRLQIQLVYYLWVESF